MVVRFLTAMAPFTTAALPHYTEYRAVQGP